MPKYLNWADDGFGNLITIDWFNVVRVLNYVFPESEDYI